LGTASAGGDIRSVTVYVAKGAHELALMAFIGRSIRNARCYVGGGPVVLETQARIYDLTSHADIHDVHANLGARAAKLPRTHSFEPARHMT
jgi:hypothetical protein